LLFGVARSGVSHANIMADHKARKEWEQA